MHNNIKEGLKDGIPIALGYFSVSFTFGMLAVDVYKRQTMSWKAWTSVLPLPREEPQSV